MKLLSKSVVVGCLCISILRQFCSASRSDSPPPSAPPPRRTSGSPSNSIPRSNSSHRRRLYYSDGDDNEYQQPPWNPSPSIDSRGFLKCCYKMIPGEWEKEVKIGGRYQNSIKEGANTMVQIRQVPGDGNCLFHSLSTCLYYCQNNKTHVDIFGHKKRKTKAKPSNKPSSSFSFDDDFYEHSSWLRKAAVDCLQNPRNPLLFLQGDEYLRAEELVRAAASQYGISRKEYCQFMAKDSYWGGGPEIVALCNVLKRPIHVYELCDADGTFVMRRMACFGSPRFDKKEPLHILSADSRFPDIAPGNQLPSGNHFLAMFPIQDNSRVSSSQSKRYVRGGGPRHRGNNKNTKDDDNQDNESNDVPLRPWWRRMLPLRSTVHADNGNDP